MSARTGLPLSQLQALEGGTVDRIPDRVVILKTLRGYADFLGLSGDRFVLTLVEHWPTTPSVQPPIVAVNGTPGVVPLTGGPTGMIPSTAASTTAAAGVHSGTAQVPIVLADPGLLADAGVLTDRGVPTQAGLLVDTGVTAAVPGPHHHAPAHHPTGAPAGLRILVGLVGLAVLVGVAGLLIHKFEPGWLQSIGITHADQPTTSHKTAPAHTVTKTTSPTAKPADFTVASTSPTTASFDVRAPTFMVQVVAVGNDSWVEATEPGQTAPLFAGILQTGQSKNFVVQHSLTVKVGSAAAHIFVSVGKQNVGFYLPPAAPYTMTFQVVS